jgi:hypothetical protein
MNNELKKLLIELNLNIEQETILAYIDGNLNKSENNRIKLLIELNPDLLKFVNELTRVITNPIISKPPAHLHKSILAKLGYEEKNIMDIALSILSNGLNIISGINFLVPISPMPAFRSNSTTELFFKNELSEYFITCICTPIDDITISIHFKLISKNNSPLKNIQFKLYQNDNKLKSLLTNSEGNTKSVIINKGKYKISVNKMKNLGEINLDIS